jgi:hypothetical protein
VFFNLGFILRGCLHIIRNHIKYFKYVLKHKWYVFLEACKLGIPWRGLFHDMSKFSLAEWTSRVEGFSSNCLKQSDGTFDLSKANDGLVSSLVKHYHNNPHHWQWWVTFLETGSMIVLPMSDKYKREMLADWLAVSRMSDRLDVIPWYLQNKDKIILHPETRKWIEIKLGIINTDLSIKSQA